MSLPRTISCTLGLLLLASVSPGSVPGPPCPNPQSPRNLNRHARPSLYDARSRTSIVSHATADSLVYTPRAGGDPQTLERCGQHYHFPIENPQGCRVPAPSLTPVGEGTPAPGQWVEIHTVYAAKVKPDDCDPETLECCLEGPFLVRSFEARVTPRGVARPILPPPGRPLAEWSGSTTGPDSIPGQCKPAAQWSFRLGCGFTVSTAQLRQFHHTDKARAVQPPYRLSDDLTLVLP